VQISIPVPPAFNFKRTAKSHGWRSLLPFEYDDSTWSITRVLSLQANAPVTIHITFVNDALQVDIPRRTPSKRDIAQITRDVRHMFRLDDEMNVFYAAVAGDPNFSWIVREGAGRLLRSPTVYEDLVKTICTTNCSWALTTKMVEGMVKHLGRASQDGRRAFPTPEAMAAEPESFYRDVVRAGYRASYFKELAGRVASGELDVESWLTSELSTAELKREMKRVKGVGEYAADNLLKLLGRYDCLALDSWVRATFSRLHNKGRVAPDHKIARHYARFREWRGLALWCDITRDWIEIRDEG
jgi:3-methyladenine DNA glycosylase/8-oxoguanine DNA glycosylase